MSVDPTEWYLVAFSGGAVVVAGVGIIYQRKAYKKQYPSGLSARVEQLETAVKELTVELKGVHDKMTADDAETQLMRGELETNKALAMNIAQRLEAIADKSDSRLADVSEKIEAQGRGISDRIDQQYRDLGTRIDRIYERLGGKQQ